MYIFATTNPGKMREIAAIFGESGLTVASLPDMGADWEIKEDGATFTENAVKKAAGCAERLRELNQLPAEAAVLADDSGLVIDALDGQPGVYSARFLGADTPYVQKNKLILDRLSGVPDDKRTARFVCAIACVLPDNRLLTTEGVLEGYIARAPKGTNGFGYDPIFYVPEYGLTSAELSPEVKNKCSHRGRALRALLKALTNQPA